MGFLFFSFKKQIFVFATQINLLNWLIILYSKSIVTLGVFFTNTWTLRVSPYLAGCLNEMLTSTTGSIIPFISNLNQDFLTIQVGQFLNILKSYYDEQYPFYLFHNI